jgi:hypothetical protein
MVFGLFRSKALAVADDEIDEAVPWEEREHNAQLKTVAKDEEKVVAVAEADAISKRVYDGIDEQVSDLQAFRDKLRKRKPRKG